MDFLLIALGVVCLLLGMLGCVFPLLPGPPLAYAALVLLHFTDKVQFTLTRLLIWLLVVVAVQLLDYFVPMLGSKYTGSGKWGSWGCVIGTVIGLFFLPWGVLLGPFLGALVGELLGNRSFDQALKSGFGSLIGFFFGVVLKVLVCGWFCYCFISALV